MTSRHSWLFSPEWPLEVLERPYEVFRIWSWVGCRDGKYLTPVLLVPELESNGKLRLTCFPQSCLPTLHPGCVKNAPKSRVWMPQQLQDFILNSEKWQGLRHLHVLTNSGSIAITTHGPLSTSRNHLCRDINIPWAIPGMAQPTFLIPPPPQKI